MILLYQVMLAGIAVRGRKWAECREPPRAPFLTMEVKWRENVSEVQEREP
jgi:hypothetical protein